MHVDSSDLCVFRHLNYMVCRSLEGGDGVLRTPYLRPAKSTSRTESRGVIFFLNLFL